MTPETPDSFLMHVDWGSGNHYRLGQEDVFAAPVFYPNYHPRYVTEPLLSHLLSDLYSQSSCSANYFLLADYPSPSYTPIQHWSQSRPHQSNRYSPSAYPESQLESDVDSLMPDSDYHLDRWDGHKFAEDLSPLAIDDCQLLPAFKDVFGNDLNSASHVAMYSQFSKVFLW